MLNITPAHVDVSATIAMLLARCQERQRQRTLCAVQHQLGRNRTAAAEHPHLNNTPPAWHAHSPIAADRPAPPEAVPSQPTAELATAPPSPSLLPVDEPIPVDAPPVAAQPVDKAGEVADYQEFLRVLAAIRAERELAEADASSLAAQGCEILARVSSTPEHMCMLMSQLC